MNEIKAPKTLWQIRKRHEVESAPPLDHQTVVNHLAAVIRLDPIDRAFSHNLDSYRSGYRDPRTTRESPGCFVGRFIPDYLYVHAMEGRDIIDLLHADDYDWHDGDGLRFALRLAGAGTDAVERFWSRVQDIHDASRLLRAGEEDRWEIRRKTAAALARFIRELEAEGWGTRIPHDLVVLLDGDVPPPIDPVTWSGASDPEPDWV